MDRAINTTSIIFLDPIIIVLHIEKQTKTDSFIKRSTRYEFYCADL